MPHYFDESPSVPSNELELRIEGRLTLRTDRGVFSHGRLNPGTALLLRQAPALAPAGTFLDLGCGAGPIALTMAHRSPRAKVWAIDVNERARELTAWNASANDLPNVVVAAPADVPAELRFDVIWTNPPIRIGKPALHELLTTWLGRLADGGHGLLVVQRHLGADTLQAWLTEHGFPTTRLASARGYRLLLHRP
jgi:16S rRNA (guanine1207-N2)-methyltransferase